MGVIQTAVLGIENGALFGSLIGQLSMITSIAANAVAPKIERMLSIKALLLVPMALSILIAQAFCAHPTIPLLIFMDIVFVLLGRLGAVAHQVIHFQLMDYDALNNGGTPRPSMISATFGTLMQYVSAVSDSIPMAIMGSLSYANNGGCDCGCGVPCSSPHLRWDCPLDKGYACTNRLEASNPPFFGDPSRQAPCTWQPAAILSYVWTVNMLIVPVLLAWSFIVTMSYPLLDIADEVKAACAQLIATGIARDPLTGITIRISQDNIHEVHDALNHFSELEAGALRDGSLRTWLIVQKSVLLCAIALCLFIQLNFYLTSLQQTYMLAMLILMVGYLCFSLRRSSKVSAALRQLQQRDLSARFDMEDAQRRRLAILLPGPQQMLRRWFLRQREAGQSRVST